jgi:hypothetical protein
MTPLGCSQGGCSDCGRGLQAIALVPMGGNKVSPNPWLVDPLGQWIQLNFRHRKILAIVGRQHAAVHDRRGSDDRID